MSGNAEPTIRVRVDPTNPGQFFACCGLLELADRLWGGVEGWYAAGEPFFCLRLPVAEDRSLAKLIREVTEAGLVGELSPALQQEREALEKKRRQLRREHGALAAEEEERRKELVKVAHRHAEEGRVAVRNIRREAKEMIEELEDSGEVSEDDAKRGLEELQKPTDKAISDIDALLAAKDKEIMEV